jgi:hypothetical protein
MTEATFIILDVGPSETGGYAGRHEPRRRLDVFYIHFPAAAPGAAPASSPSPPLPPSAHLPLTNGFGVLLGELFKVLPRAPRGRVVTLNKDKPERVSPSSPPPPNPILLPPPRERSPSVREITERSADRVGGTRGQFDTG